MRTLRWAAELSAQTDDRVANLGVAELAALLESDLLDESEKVFVEAALDAVVEDVAAELDQLGDDVEVVQYVHDEASLLSDPSAADVPLEPRDRDGGDEHG